MVLATAPWFLIPGAQVGRFVVVLRLARLARLAMASRASRRLVERLGQVRLQGRTSPRARCGLSSSTLLCISQAGFLASMRNLYEWATNGPS